MRRFAARYGPARGRKSLCVALGDDASSLQVR